jgi:hypothetical protein
MDEYDDFLDDDMLNQMVKATERAEAIEFSTNNQKLTTKPTAKNKPTPAITLLKMDPKQKTLWDYGSSYIIPGTKKIERVNLNPFSVPPKPVIESDHEYNQQLLETWIYPTNYPERECLYF